MDGSLVLSRMHNEHPLRQALKRADMSQSRLARALDMNESLVSHYLSGRRTPPEDFYLRAANILGVQPEDILPEGLAAV